MDMFLSQFLNVEIIGQALPLLLRGLGVTAQLCLAVVPLGLIGGLLIALVCLSKHRAIRWPAFVLVDFFRAAGLARQIVTPELRVRNDFALTSKIRRMERVIDGARPMVALEIEFALHNYRDNKLILLETYSEEVVAGSDGMGDAISALDAALTAILNRFLADAG